MVSFWHTLPKWDAIFAKLASSLDSPKYHVNKVCKQIQLLKEALQLLQIRSKMYIALSMLCTVQQSIDTFIANDIE